MKPNRRPMRAWLQLFGSKAAQWCRSRSRRMTVAAADGSRGGYRDCVWLWGTGALRGEVSAETLRRVIDLLR